MTPPERLAASDAEFDVLGVRVHMLDETAALGRIERIHDVAVLRRAAARGWPVFLLGGQSRVAERAAERLSDRIAGLCVVGTHHGLFTDAESDAIVDHVRACQASVLMVALGQPRQEQWLLRHLERTGARVGLGLGGFLDFSAGVVRRAPAWMNRAGQEWTFRLAQEPRRLGHRYLVGNPVFLGRVLRPGAGNGTPARTPTSPELEWAPVARS